MFGFLNVIRSFFWPMSQSPDVCTALDWICRDSSGVMRVWLPNAVEPVLNFAVENFTPARAVACGVGIGVATYVGYNALIFSNQHAQQREPKKVSQVGPVLFENPINITIGKEIEESVKISPEPVKIEPPELYLCPISFEIMTDPVITPSGHTFQRSQIEESLRRNQIDPLDRAPCKIEQLVPNLVLRDIIEAWLDAHPEYERENKIVRRNRM